MGTGRAAGATGSGAARVIRLPMLPPRLTRALMLGHGLLRHASLVGVRVVVLDAQGRVFLVRHSYVPGWHLPGGGVEVGETARAAASREVREEAALAIEEDARLFGLYLNRALFGRNHVALFVARNPMPLAGAEADWEIVERGFFSPGALPPGTSGGTRRRLAEVLDGVPPAETW